MADDTATPDAAATAEPAADAQQTQPDVPQEVKAALKKANKEAETLRLKLKEIEDRDKSEVERLTEAKTAAEKAAADALREATRLRVIAESQLDPDLHEFVFGDDEDEMRARAQKLKERAAATTATTPGPRPDNTQGATTGATALALNGDPLTAAVKAKLGIR